MSSVNWLSKADLFYFYFLFCVMVVLWASWHSLIVVTFLAASHVSLAGPGWPALRYVYGSLSTRTRKKNKHKHARAEMR
ncbi:hypothetical protein LY76DRAFT_148368 [Colletotrichum caudatum]|nr:hypothetical protein LY76DRAFT_148368 [Colletotrichum caudatum]